MKLRFMYWNTLLIDPWGCCGHSRQLGVPPHPWQKRPANELKINGCSWYDWERSSSLYPLELSRQPHTSWSTLTSVLLGFWMEYRDVWPRFYNAISPFIGQCISRIPVAQHVSISAVRLVPKHTSRTHCLRGNNDISLCTQRRLSTHADQPISWFVDLAIHGE